MDPDGGKLGTELGADDTLGSDEGLLLGILDSEGEVLGLELGVSLSSWNFFLRACVLPANTGPMASLSIMLAPANFASFALNRLK